MYRLTSKLIIYRGIVTEDSILYKLSEICKQFHSNDYDKDELIGEILTQVNRLLDVATKYGFNDNLWHNYLSFLLATTETPFTLVSEKVGANKGSVNDFAKNDLKIFKQLFDYDFSLMEQKLGINCFSVIEDYRAVVKEERIFNKSVSDKVRELCKSIECTADVDVLYKVVTEFYKKYGVGEFGLNKAFRLSEDGSGKLIPITLTSNVTMDDLVGYEREKERLLRNTRAFVQGRPANNVLLYGDAGTGKSTSIKAILNQFYPDGLRMIEVYKHEFKYLASIISRIKNRNYRFIIYMDDLSFEDFETDYKYLKAVIEGGLEPKPENVLIYATSNRRHLLKENFSDRPSLKDDDVHRSDSMQEKLSLSARFGESIGFFKPAQKEYYNIVTELAKRHHDISLSEDELLLKANQWALNHGGPSGRAAQQFINYLRGAVSED